MFLWSTFSSLNEFVDLLFLDYFLLQKEVIISAIDYTHLLFRFQYEDDFLKVWLKEVIYLKGFFIILQMDSLL
uniref:Uncharacterized protein n=1 Tax=Nelumbo nucifera TaxID=4432 RepID=A0A822YLB8_NELNU|nr:TPA_asm: hypothetical protein HUJ06_011734 [Nelumbo nucifera]